METTIELLSPAGDLECLKFAVIYGANAVYVGADTFGMRSSSKNFTPQALKEGVDFAHKHGVKVYLTLNALPTNEEVVLLPQLLKSVIQAGVDAVIVADIGVLAMVKQYAPDIEIHLSTQAGVTNYATALAAYELGAKRVVLARELSLEEISKIHEQIPKELELEVFVHGSMCMGFSGRCLLSKYMTGRDANHGDCAQPCRWKYHLSEENRPGQFFEIGETEDGTYLLNADDLCMVSHLEDVVKAGADSLKIEGRAKSFYYVASTTFAYRKALNAVQDKNLTAEQKSTLIQQAQDELNKTSHRNYSTGFFYGRDNATQNDKQGGYIREWQLLGVVEECNGEKIKCSQRGKFKKGDTLEILTPSGNTIEYAPEVIWDDKNTLIEATPHAKMIFYIPKPNTDECIEPYSILRKKI